MPNELNMAIPNGDSQYNPDDTAGNQRGPTPVIIAFLWNGQRVLLALRSESVSTFPGHWAGISGYVEGDDPLAWALVEIREETGIPLDAVTLRRVGSPIVVDAPAYNRQLQVHPFLFAVDDGVTPQPDLEATRFEWVDLSDMQRRERTPTVPHLYDAFERVWPPWPGQKALEANVELACRWLRHDRQMGAGTLARAAARELVKLVRLTEAQPRDDAIGPLRAAAARLRWVRPSMAAPVNLLADATSAKLKLNNRANLNAAANKVAASAQAIAAKYDGASFGAIDGLIPGEDKYKGSPSP